MATITTTVRNLGLEPVSGLEVGLYHDNLGVATLVSTRTLTTTFQPGDALPIAWEVVSGSGQQFYYAVVTGGDSDMGTINNYAYGVLNALAQPRITSVLESYRFVNTLELDWQPEDNPIVAGYRILRATASEGPYELVGEATGTAFADLGLDHDTGYFYKVQAFDVDGLLSVASAPVVAGLAPHRAYLPVIGRD